MELCIKCGNPTAGDVTGSLYCIVCGEPQPQQVYMANSGCFTMKCSPEEFEAEVNRARLAFQGTASLSVESPVFRGILADVPVLPGELISSSSNRCGIARTSLYRFEKYKAARSVLREGRQSYKEWQNT